MKSLCIAFLSAMLTACPAAVSTNLAVQATNQVAAQPGPDDPVEKQFKKMMEEDDAAMEEVDKWIQENQNFAAKGGGESNAELNRRIRQRLDSIRTRYEDFIKEHPSHAAARVAYGSFLGDTGDEDGAQTQLEKALELDPKDPAIYNNLANIYGHTGPVTKAFEYYAKAIELKPDESVYYHNFGTTVYLFRMDATQYFGINEQQVFDKALELYAKAMKYDPTNFPLASDVAQTYYGIKPRRTEEALRSWTNALAVAHDEIEREGVYLHLARVKLHDGRFDEARAHLNAVTNSMYRDLKARIARSLEDEQKQRLGETNKAPPAETPPAQAPITQPAEKRPSQ